MELRSTYISGARGSSRLAIAPSTGFSRRPRRAQARKRAPSLRYGLRCARRGLVQLTANGALTQAFYGKLAVSRAKLETDHETGSDGDLFRWEVRPGVGTCDGLIQATRASKPAQPAITSLALRRESVVLWWSAYRPER